MHQEVSRNAVKILVYSSTNLDRRKGPKVKKMEGWCYLARRKNGRWFPPPEVASAAASGRWPTVRKGRRWVAMAGCGETSKEEEESEWKETSRPKRDKESCGLLKIWWGCFVISKSHG